MLPGRGQRSGTAPHATSVMSVSVNVKVKIIVNV